MKRLRTYLLAAAVSSSAGAQALQAPLAPVTPGVAFPVVLRNDTPDRIRFDCGPFLLWQPTGERIGPLLNSGLSCELDPGNQTTLTFATPATGPGSSGSFVLQAEVFGGPLAVQRSIAAARIDVGTTTPIPGTHVLPGWHFGVAFGTGTSFQLDVANLTAATQQITALTVDVLAPGESAPRSTTTMTGLVIPAARARAIDVPLDPLAPGHYTVRARWVDPVTATPQTRTFGLRDIDGIMRLQLPAGRAVPRSGAVPVEFLVRPLRRGAATPFVFVLGTLPGVTPLPGGDVAPVLATDPLLALSLSGVLLSGGAGVTLAIPVRVGHNIFAAQHATGTRIVHPDIPAALGLRVRVAGLLIDTAWPGVFATQAEEVVFL
jgi:hypothetical protein